MNDPNQIERPYKDLWRPELQRFARENWDDPVVLAEVLSELLFRTKKPAIEYRAKIVERLIELQDQPFQWPTTDAESGFGTMSEMDWPKVGLLSYLGYRTGQNGALEESRRSILDYIFTKRVPNVDSVEYMAEWGKPSTCTRLSKLAESIAAFARNAKRKTGDSMELSIEEWESDLSYLKDEFYTGKRCDFTWPRT